jgi:hypothetical protein
MILTIAQYSSKHYTFDISDPTILNYLEGYSNKNSIFEYRGYPTTNLQTYQPGPLPYIYVFKLSWVMHTYFDINPIYLSNILLAIYPTILIIIASTILYKNNLKLLSIITLSITILVQYTNRTFNGSYRNTERLDIGTDYITLIATLTLMMLILSYKKPHSSHLPLLAFSGLLINNHFSAFALAPFTILYALYLIILSVKAKRYKINFKALIPLSIFIYLPLIYRFMVEPSYLYQALTAKTNSSSGRLFPDKWSYFYETTPIKIFINSCDKSDESFYNTPCLTYNNAKISVVIFAVLSVILLLKIIKKQNNFIKLIGLTSFLLINYNTATGFEPRHSSIATALTLSIIIYYLSKNIFTTSLAVIMILLSINFLATDKYQYTGYTTYKKIQKENFSPSFIAEMKKAKFKIDVCYLTFEINCTKGLEITKKTLLSPKKTLLLPSYDASNIAHQTILEMLKNKIDICVFDKTNLFLSNLPKNNLLSDIDNLLCTSTEIKDKKRNQLYLLRDQKLETAAILYDYTKIATVVNKDILIENWALESSFSIPSGSGLYLKKDAIGVNPNNLVYLNNIVYESRLPYLKFSRKFRKETCTLTFFDNAKNKYYCYLGAEDDLVVSERNYKDKVDLYDPR